MDENLKLRRARTFIPFRKAEQCDTPETGVGAYFSPITKSRIIKSANRSRILNIYGSIKKGEGYYEQDPLKDPKSQALNDLTIDDRGPDVDEYGNDLKGGKKFVDHLGRVQLDESPKKTTLEGEIKRAYGGVDPNHLGSIGGDVVFVTPEKGKIFTPSEKQLREGSEDPDAIGRAQKVLRQRGIDKKQSFPPFDPQGVLAQREKEESEKVKSAYNEVLDKYGLSEDPEDPVEEFIFSPAFEEYMAENDWEFDDDLNVIDGNGDIIPWEKVYETAKIYKGAIEEEVKDKFEGKGITDDEMKKLIEIFGM